MDYDVDDTPAERALRSATGDLRRSLKDVIAEAQRVLDQMDNGFRPGGAIYPGSIVDASRANGYAAQVDALLNLPWGDMDVAVGSAERAQEILETAGVRA